MIGNRVAPTFRTARLTLRPWTVHDALPLHRILAEEGVLRYFPNPTPPPLDRVGRLVANQIKHWQEHGFGWWAVELRSSGELIGWNGLQYLPETDEVEIGYLLRKDCWDRGLAVEGGQVGLRYGFEVVGLCRIIAVAHPDNLASQRVMEKLGMSFVEQTVYFGMQVRRYLIDASTWTLPSRALGWTPIV